MRFYSHGSGTVNELPRSKLRRYGPYIIPSLVTPGCLYRKSIFGFAWIPSSSMRG